MADVARKVADQASRELALDVSRSVIVQAPAGSGKTELLTQRMLKLLAIVNDPEEVLAITFTRKAAGEMRDRLLQSLRRAAQEQEPDSPHEARNWHLARGVLARDKKRGWHLAEHPARLRIMTIDALCARLTRQMPLLARVGANVEIAAAPELLYDEAANASLELLATEDPCRDDIETLVAHMDNNLAKTAALIAQMLSRREQWLRHILPGSAWHSDRHKIERAIAAMLSSELAQLREKFPDAVLHELLVQARTSAEVLAGQPGENPLAALTGKQMPATSSEDLHAWQALAHFTLTVSGEWRRSWNKTLGFPPGEKNRKTDMADLVARLADKEDLRQSLLIVRDLPESTLAESQWAALRALLNVLPVAAAHLELVFRRHGKVDYTAISRAALAALGEAMAPSDLALALDYRIQHVLVDEFQDTSASQFELLVQLIAGWTPGDGRTIFCVGDPMQSIYRFREAEVSLFLRAWREGIGELPLTPVRLTVNFRSQKGVVDWVNQAFPDIMPATADLQTAAVPFTRSDAYHSRLQGKAVAFHPLIDQSREAEAARVAELIKKEREKNPQSKLAILVSGRNHLREIMPALRRAGLMPQAVEIERLDRRTVVHDLVALVQAMLHRGDRSAWLAVLRAPWCGLCMTDLHRLVANSAGRTVPALLDDACQLAGLSDEGADLLKRFKNALWPMLTQAGRRPLRSWVEGAWRRLGGPACVADISELANANAFFELLAKLEVDNAMEDPLVLKDRLSELYASADPDADENLLIMTIHKAKGLQFDVVIVPGLDRRGSDEKKQLLRWMEFPREGGGIDLVLSPVGAVAEGKDKLYEYLHGLEKRRRDLEQARMLYVAITRARQRVHLVACAKSRPLDDEFILSAPTSRSMLATLWPAAGPFFEAALAARSQSLPEDSVAAPQAVAPTIYRLGENWTLPACTPAVRVRKTLQPHRVINEDAISFDWAGQTARHVGTVVHEALRILALTGAASQDCSTLAGLERKLRVRLLELGTHGSDVAAALALSLTAIRNTCEDERGRWILSDSHRDGHSEFALTGIEQGTVYNLVLDRTFVDDLGRRWVIDFKVGVHEGRDKEAFFDQEVARYQDQLRRYAVSLANYDERPVRAALYFPLYCGWREWDPFAAELRAFRDARSD